MAIAVWSYAAWTIVHTLFIGPLYNPAGLFDPIFLLIGFSIGRELDRARHDRALAGLACGLAALAIWAAIQLPFGAVRGQAHFQTPNTLASVLNFGLAPMLFLIATGEKRNGVCLLGGLLFAGLGATFSWGGAVALAAGLALAAFFTKRMNFRYQGIARVLFVIFVAAAGVLTVSALRGTITTSVPIGGVILDPAAPPLPKWGADSVSPRLQLYDLAWAEAKQHLCCGIGYLGFRMVLEVARARVPSYGRADETYFVHNDYLQALLELGPVGLVALLLVLLLPVTLIKKAAVLGYEDRIQFGASVAAIGTILVHAIVDFPLHIPILLLLLGFAVGGVDRLVAMPSDVRPRWKTQSARLAQIAIGSLLIITLTRPVLAEAFAAYGMQRWRAGDGQAAALGLELARQCDARDWRYHLYAGEFWLVQAQQTHKPEAARMAEKAFMAGSRANPLDPMNRLGRVFTHLGFAALLIAPADSATLRAWAGEALALAPLNPIVRQKYAEIIQQLEGRR